MTRRHPEWLFPTLLPAVLLLACNSFQPTYVPAPEATASILRGDTTRARGSVDGNPCLADVSRAIERVPTRGRPLGFHLGGKAAVGGYRRHWQGVQRPPTDVPYLFISRSGGDPAVIIVRLERPKGRGELLGGDSSGPRAAGDRVVATISQDSGRIHAGGLALVGTVLLVPTSGGRHSAVTGYEVSDPERPQRLWLLDHSAAMPPSTPGDASAVGAVRLEDGRYLLVLGVRSSKLLEFYRSRGTGLRAPDLSFEYLGRVEALDVGGFQHLALLTQCDGTLFLAGTHNTGLPPPSRGRDHVHWYRLAAGRDALPRLRRAGERWLHCSECNLAAGAGFYLTRRGELVLYATEFWQRKASDWVVVEEFGPEPGATGDP